MTAHPNLISESLLVMETIDYLISVGGRASAARLVEYVMSIGNANEVFAVRLMADIVSRDNRLRMDGDQVELAEADHDSIDLCNASFVVIDLETTGAKAPPCRITEVGAFRVENSAVTASFQTLVNPEMPIPQFITELTGISDEMVSTAPRFSDIADDLLRFIGDSVLVAHNSPFDLAFLNHEIARVHAECRIANPDLCTVRLSRQLLPDIENHKLKTVARHYAIDLINHHRASDDAYATAMIFINLLEVLRERGISDLGSARKLGNRKFYARRQAAA
ncbi:MAG: PolC-type DNA polymerase III [Pyrinomonadaceae bacterium]